jgi:hypothetical protein
MNRIVAIAGLVIAQTICGVSAAADLHGRVAALNLDKRTIGIDVEGHEHGYPLGKDCKIYRKSGGRTDTTYNEVPDGLKAITIGDEVIATTELRDGDEQVVRIKIESIPRRVRQVGRDISGKVAAINAKKGIISLSSTDKDQVYVLAKDVNVYKLSGSGSRGRFVPADGGLDDVSVGVDVMLNLVKHDDKEQVAYILLGKAPSKKSK